MTAPKLVLHPVSLQQRSAPATLLAALHGLGLLGTDFELDGRRHFRTGPGFLEHITFLGCAPSIELEPPADAPAAAARAGRFCHLHLAEAAGAERLRLRPGYWPRCRACRSDIAPAAFAAGPDILCPGCGRRCAPEQLNWRQAGGYAGRFLEIWGIHTGEAVPGDRLLEALAAADGGAWSFFYIED